MSGLGGTRAGFRYTVSGQPMVHQLAYPMKLEMAPAHRTRRYVSEPLDLSSRDVITVGSGRYEVEATLRFNRRSEDLLRLLAQGASGTVLTYYPDLSRGTGYPLWLISHGDVVDLSPDPDRFGYGEYAVRVRFRDASASGTSLERLFSPWLFRWEAGMFPAGYSFTRTGPAYAVDFTGQLSSAAENVARISYPLVDGVRVPALMVEEARTNLTTTDDLTSWSVTGTPTVTDGQDDPAGGADAYTIEDADGAADAFVRVNVSFTGDGRKSAVFVVRENTMASAGTQGVGIYDATAAEWRLLVEISAWVDGGPICAATSGTLIGTRYIGNGFWAIHGRSTTVTAASTHQLRIVPAVTTSATGSIDAYRAMAFNDLVPPWSVIDATGSVGAETFYAPFTHAPQAMTAYVKLIETGSVATGSSTPGVIKIGSATDGGDPRFVLYADRAQGRYELLHDNGTAMSRAEGAFGAAPAMGDVVELRAVLNADGSVLLGQSLNGGAEATVSDSTSVTLASAWHGQRLYIGSRGDSARGILMALSVTLAAGVRSLAEMRRIA